ncbi:TerD family protein, partial [Streptomyces sp. NPDC127044]
GKSLKKTPAHQIVSLGLAHSPAGRHIFPRMTIEDNLRLGAFLRSDRPGIEKIVVTASPDAAGQTFPGIEPTATIRNADDNSVLGSFTPPRLGTETALVVVEIYLRNGAWKARAVGQGYANGLAGIATDFGVSVEEPAPA